ncbi:ABC transporter permease [Aquipuribacter nitratireducens]|uniref:ABC transporter permease n=1 Tax=Aquipuribacter nitratireducens TaxID=650104 RepID=A0ABW0GPG2_9MICO
MTVPPRTPRDRNPNATELKDDAVLDENVERRGDDEARELRAGEEGFTVKARTQRELVLRRFLRHRAAMVALFFFVAIVVLAVSSIGAGPIPGWWDKSYTQTGAVVDGGRPTLDVLPAFVDGDGVGLGEHPFGQDSIGRDYFATTMRGAQQSLQIALIVGLVATLVGTVIGSIAGYFGGTVETVLMRLVDVIIAIPLLVLAAVVGSSTDGTAAVLGLFLGIVVWTSLSRLVRGEVLSLKEREFVEAARAMGAGPFRIITRHILPNTISTIIVSATLTIAAAILLETALSFLGFGVQPPDTSLGQLISTYQTAFATRPWLFWFPGVFIIGIALTINFIGDGLRDAFDPRQNKVRA